jgi:hypothetical protein
MQGCLKMNPRQVGHATKTLSSTNGNAAPVILILVIACLALAILILCTPEAAINTRADRFAAHVGLQRLAAGLGALCSDRKAAIRVS